MPNLGIAIVRQYERGVVFRLGRLRAVRKPGFRLMIPLVDHMWKVSLRTVTMPVPGQQVITQDNVSIGVAAVAYFRRVDAVKSIVEIENVSDAVRQIAQTTVRNIVGRSLLDQVLTDTQTLNLAIREILDRITQQWGVQVFLVELKDIELPPSMQRAMARQAEAEREKRAKIIAAEGEALSAGRLAEAADVITDHPIALQLRNLQILSEIAVEKNSTIVFPAQFLDSARAIAGFVADESRSVQVRGRVDGAADGRVEIDRPERPDEIERSEEPEPEPEREIEAPVRPGEEVQPPAERPADADDPLTAGPLTADPGPDGEAPREDDQGRDPSAR
jgi:hypothetical protein